ncbi:MAG: hypothetical protein RLZZ225_274 [Pseudomonadota bacterium]
MVNLISITTPVRHVILNIFLKPYNTLIILVAEGGIEPPTQRFSVFCSTD